jgi:hypothetical protein
MNTWRAAGAAGVVAIVLAGCGGSSNKDLGYSGFISKANEVCRVGQAEVSKATSPEAATAALDKAIKKLKSLKPPDQLKPPFDSFVSTSEQELALLKKGDVAGANKLDRSTNADASKMGTKDCITQ